MVTTIFKSLCILPLFFIASFANLQVLGPEDFKWFTERQILGPHELFGNPFGNPDSFKKDIPNDLGTPLEASFTDNVVGAEPTTAANDANNNNGDQVDKQVNPFAGADGNAINSNNVFKGQWELVSENSGVSAMHSILLPKVNKVLMYDATIWKISQVQLPNGECRVLNETTGERDCFAHSVLFDVETSEVKPLELHTDTWCSSGGLDIDGNLVSTGGFQGGANTVRYLETCDQCTWREFPTALADRRWYSTQATLPDGGFIVIGGRDAFSYEYIPPEGHSNAKAFYFDFLKKTSDKDENNLYPFVHLSTDGNVFIFANSRSVLLNPNTNQIVREFPELPGGHRNYPASAMSVLLPIKLHANNLKQTPAEVLICGGSAHGDAYTQASNNIFFTALKDCGRIKITDKNPRWKRELMPTPRVMGDMMILPTGDVLLLNGAGRGASGWGFAREPNFNPVLYNPKAKMGQRFTELAPSSIARMYHSSSVVLQDGKVLVAGSNTNNGYVYDAMFPTELRVEKFSPPYLDPSLAETRPEIVVEGSADRIVYGQEFSVQFKTNAPQVEMKDVQVTMYAPAFTTHGVSMNQRLINLGLTKVEGNTGLYTVKTIAPPSGAIAPPGYYMLYVIYKGVPSVAIWVQIK